MKYTYDYRLGQLEEWDKAFYERMNQGFVCTGETLTESYWNDSGSDCGSTTFVVFKAKVRQFTPYGMCRDCGDHYIIARWSRYDRIEKGTFERTLDVEDY